MPLKTDEYWVRLIVNNKATHEEWGATQILRLAVEQAKKHKDNENYANAVPQAVLDSPPALRTAERIIKRGWDALPEQEKEQYRSSVQKANELDQPWSIAASIKYGLPDSAMGDLLSVWKLTLLLKDTEPYPLPTFTIRQARWVVRLRAALPDADSRLLFRWAALYSRWEHTAESQGRQLDTADLDAELAFEPWRSTLHEWEYDQAVLSGTVPASRYSIAQKKGVVAKALRAVSEPAGYFANNGTRSLTEVGGVEIWQRPWWPQAESIMAFWLREISIKVKRWQGIDLGYGDPLPGDKERMEWKAMARKLARLVIERAEELQRYDDAAGEREKYWVKQQRLFYLSQRLFWTSNVLSPSDMEALNTYRQMERELYEEYASLPKLSEHSAVPVNGRWEAWTPKEILKEIGYEQKGDANG